MVTTADPAPRTRRRWMRRTAVAVVVLVALGFMAIVWLNRLEFAYQGPNGAVARGDVVTIRDAAGPCGPLVVSIWRPSILGQWNQTHNGSAVGDSFSVDPHSWWQLWEGETYVTPVPCAESGAMTFRLPDDVRPGTIAVCDSARKCARLEVAEDP